MADPNGLLAGLGEKCRSILGEHEITTDVTKLQMLLAYTEDDQEQLARRLVNLDMPWGMAIVGKSPAREYALPDDQEPEPPASVARPPSSGSVAPIDLKLDEITLDPTLQVRPVDKAIAAEYAEHVEELPPVDVIEIDGARYLVNGFHRYEAHVLVGAGLIPAHVRVGTMDEARLFVAQSDTTVGLRRSRQAKRAAVLLALSTTSGMLWSDREVARHCGVSHTLVANVRAGQPGNIASYPQGGGATEDGADPESGNKAIKPSDQRDKPTPTEPPKTKQTTTMRADTPNAERKPAPKPEHKQEPKSPGQPPGLFPEPPDTEEVDREELLDDDKNNDGDHDRDNGLLNVEEQVEAPTMSEVTENIDALLMACRDDQDRIDTLDQLAEWISDQRQVLAEALEEQDGMEEDETDDDDILAQLGDL